ncbi:MAG: PIN domain-containing protein [Pirellulaceae bacterium]|nr:PIN domain-containing protein [Pirellulaceae bacterium]
MDINTWIALSIETHPQHRRARSWYEQTPLRPGDLLFCRQTELGFLRLITQAAVMARCGVRPLSNTEAIEFLDSLYADPAVSREDEHPATRSLWLQFAQGQQSSPKVWMDAYLAAFAVSHGIELVTFDEGLKNFQEHGLRLLLL